MAGAGAVLSARTEWTTRRHRFPSPMEEALLGALGSAGACLVSNPIDVARVRLQLERGRGLKLHATMVHICKTEGGPALARGLGAAMAYNVVLNATRFSSYSLLTAGGSTEQQLPPAVSGFVSGYAAGYISAPFAQAKTIQQQGAGSSKLSAVEVMRARPFAGASAWALRNAGHTSIMFSLYELVRRKLAVALPSMPPVTVNLLASLQAATVSCLVMNPFDLVATRLFQQASLGGNSTRAQAVRTAPIECVRHTLAAEGVSGFYRGLAANVARVVPHTVITFLILEALRDKLEQSRSFPKPSAAVVAAHSDPHRIRASPTHTKSPEPTTEHCATHESDWRWHAQLAEY